MDEQNKNLILATALSFLVILVWFFLFPPEEPVTPTETVAEQAETGILPSAGSGRADTGTTNAEPTSQVIEAAPSSNQLVNLVHISQLSVGLVSKVCQQRLCQTQKRSGSWKTVRH